jgi:U6 snRNA m6A methyltransferase
VRLDFSDHESRIVLTKSCLHQDFDLDVNLPSNRLCPTLPLRINYILFIEDLLSHCQITDEVTGVDIGTGASSIYCLLIARMNHEWKMFALENDPENVKLAQENITKNLLEDKITLVNQIENEKIFEKLFQLDDASKSFCLCNPPFFASNSEMTEAENRTGKRKKLLVEQPSKETVTDGGEIAFVTKIFLESVELKEKIEIYSTMLGCKKNFESFLKLLKDHKMYNFATTKFIQGNVQRWGVAWSFGKRNLRNFKDHLYQPPEKASPILKHVISNMTKDAVIEKVTEILTNLKISMEVNEESSKWTLEAKENTWVNQRRKRRAEQRSEEISITSNAIEDLTMNLEIIEEESNVLIQMQYVSGSMNRDCVNQILQQIKNKINQPSKIL